MADLILCEQMLQEEIEKAETIGIQLRNISPKITLMNRNNYYGYCDFGRPCKISLNKSFVTNAEPMEIRATLMHEVLHTTKKSNGHDEFWKRSVKKVLEHYSYNGYEDFHLCDKPYSRERIGKHYKLQKSNRNKETVKYKVICPCCGTTWNYTRMTNTVKNPSNYWCTKCGKEHRLIRIL